MPDSAYSDCGDMPVLAAVLEVITREGFDMRISEVNGSLGGSIYFAEDLCTSLNYISRVPFLYLRTSFPFPPSRRAASTYASCMPS